VHTQLKGVEKNAASADIPMLVAGDFNTTPGSAAHSMLVKGAVQPNNPVRGWLGVGWVGQGVAVAAQQPGGCLGGRGV
jgi:endonuclease/exonuclease/phosphatase (EEP) superfamily protein YafD